MNIYNIDKYMYIYLWSMTIVYMNVYYIMDISTEPQGRKDINMDNKELAKRLGLIKCRIYDARDAAYGIKTLAVNDGEDAVRCMASIDTIAGMTERVMIETAEELQTIIEEIKKTKQ